VYRMMNRLIKKIVSIICLTAEKIRRKTQCIARRTAMAKRKN
jgi:hypothetical protein